MSESFVNDLKNMCAIFRSLTSKPAWNFAEVCAEWPVQSPNWLILVLVSIKGLFRRDNDPLPSVYRVPQRNLAQMFLGLPRDDNILLFLLRHSVPASGGLDTWAPGSQQRAKKLIISQQYFFSTSGAPIATKLPSSTAIWAFSYTCTHVRETARRFLYLCIPWEEIWRRQNPASSNYHGLRNDSIS